MIFPPVSAQLLSNFLLGFVAAGVAQLGQFPWNSSTPPTRASFAPPRKQTAVFFIDEIDRSLHPILVWNFLDFFLKSCEGEQRQIIVTTHESNLLDLDLLRRDEIWFAEKNQEGATHLYSLADFKVRKDLEIRKHYLHGRFGAVPFLGNLDRLLEQQDKSE